MSKTMQNFVANPGLGWLFFDKQATDTVGFWAGNMTLDSGQKVRVQATAINEPGNRHYDVKVMNVDSKVEDPMWKTLATFEMPAFGKSTAAKVVDTDIGRLKLWRQMPVTKADGRQVAACIRIRQLRRSSGAAVNSPKPL